MSVVYRKFDSQKTNIDSKCIKITHAILLPFHIKNHNQSNGHELKEKKNVPPIGFVQLNLALTNFSSVIGGILLKPT